MINQEHGVLMTRQF